MSQLDTPKTLSRQQRMTKKAQAKRKEEASEVIARLRASADYSKEYEYFLGLVEAGFSTSIIRERVGKPVAALLCLQAPLELFHAYGIHPFKIFSGSQTASRLSAPNLSTLMCPMIRSALGALQLDSEECNDPAVIDSGYSMWVIPTTCDWVVRFPEMMANCGYKRSKPLYFMEMPHVKESQPASKRWLEELYGLGDFLREQTGKRPDRKTLFESIQVYQRAWQAFVRFTNFKRKGKVSAEWAMLVANAFFLDTVEQWTTALEALFPHLEQVRPAQGKPIIVTGSPIFFPNFKILELVEKAGLFMAVDDLCSSERLFPGAVFAADPSEFGLMQALADRYREGCLCPTFANNERRFVNILSPLRKIQAKGIVFHVLKGCHPFDIASFSLERLLKNDPIPFIKLETDYTAEDSQNLLTRLEAFRSTLVGI